MISVPVDIFNVVSGVNKCIGIIPLFIDTYFLEIHLSMDYTK